MKELINKLTGELMDGTPMHLVDGTSFNGWVLIDHIVITDWYIDVYCVDHQYPYRYYEKTKGENPEFLTMKEFFFK